MDCFYAAVEIRDNPRLKGKPVAVGGRPGGRGVLTTANYEARKFGVGSAMPVNRALRLCPKLNLVAVNFSKYRFESQKIRSVFDQFSQKIEPLSLDEAYLDVSNSLLFEGSATRIAKAIRDQIFYETKLTASAGIAPNKFLAKVASDWEKPNGQFTVTPQIVSAFTAQLDVGKIPGIGKVTLVKMHRLGYYKCKDIRNTNIEKLVHQFGEWGHHLYDLSRGIDNRSVGGRGERKSLSAETTFAKDLNFIECQKELEKFYPHFVERIKNADIDDRIQSLVIKLKYMDFQQTTLERSKYKVPKLEIFMDMLEEAFYREGKPVRLLGLGVKLKSEKKLKKTLQMSMQLD